MSNSEAEAHDVVFESHPTIRPTIIQMIVLLVFGIILVMFLNANPSLLGGEQIAGVGVLVIVILVILGLFRLLIRAIVYTRTTYEILEDSVRKEYELLFRRERKTVPFELVRSHEFSQNRIESALGFGTVKLNQGLGTLTLANIEHPHEFNEHVHDQLTQQNTSEAGPEAS